MDKIRLPSLIHYELVLQVLERQSMPDADRDPAIREQVQLLIVALRKAVSQHKSIERTCDRQGCEVEPVWGLNSVIKPQIDT
jgi:hypothetical protein